MAVAAPHNETASETPFLTPYKLNRLILEKSGVEGSFDSKGVDCPFVFTADDKLYMTYIGFDGTGYQTGLASSKDLAHWKREGLIIARDSQSKYTQHNIAMTSILRDEALSSHASLEKINGHYLGTWHAYPNAGYEEGAAVIGLAWSDDLRHWSLSDPVLLSEEGAQWEKGGLYKSYILKDADTYYLFYNAKNQTTWKWHEQIGVATSTDLKHWTRFSGNPIVSNGASGSGDEVFASDPFIMRYGTQWLLYYYGFDGTGKARDFLAVGADPFHFKKVDKPVVDIGTKGSIDEQLAHKPALFSWHGDLYHFYTAQSGDMTRGITVARSRPW